MNKAILLADLHLHHLPTWRLDWCADFITKLLDDYGQDKHKYDLYILGDVIEIRDKVDSRVLNLLIKLIKEWSAGDVVWMSGQHDSYLPGKATLHELRGMKLENGEVFVVDNNTLKHRNNFFVPFQRRLEDYRKCLSEVPDNSIVFTHMPTKEILELYGAKDVDAISVKEFKRFKLAISGDIHKFYDFKELSYVGAPSQRDWRDKGVEGQIGKLCNGIFTRIPTTHPKHIEVTSADEIPKDGDYIIKTPRGSHIAADNVISSFETSNLKLESVELVVTGTVTKQLSGYIKLNKPPVSATRAKDAAKVFLEESA